MTQQKETKLTITLIVVLALAYFTLITVIQEQQLQNAIYNAKQAEIDRNKCAKNLGELLEHGVVTLTVKGGE